MNIRVTHDNEHDVWTIIHQDCHIKTSADIVQWRKLLDAEFAQLGGQRAFILIDLAGFRIEPAMMDEYGRNAKELVSRHAEGAIRYGRGGDAQTRTEISLQAIVNNFPANIFPDRDSALAAVAHLRLRGQAVGT